MDLLAKMGEAIDYIDANLTKKVDYEAAARIACCSLARFQNIFLFLTGITPSEYARRRRMALSAEELVGTDIRIIDLSWKYGYESPEAFSRSFKAFHGISPSNARKYGRFMDYPRISFQITITGGHFTMETTAQLETYRNILVKMETVELPEPLKLAGVSSEALPNFLNIQRYHDAYKPLMAGRHAPYTEIGMSIRLGEEGLYLFGCQVDSIDELPDGMRGVDTGLTRFACLTFRTQPGGDLVGGEDGPGEGMITAGEYLLNEWIPRHRDRLYNYTPPHTFEVKHGEKNYRIANLPAEGAAERYFLTYWLEVYKVPDVEKDPEMCFYIPWYNPPKATGGPMAAGCFGLPRSPLWKALTKGVWECDLPDV